MWNQTPGFAWLAMDFGGHCRNSARWKRFSAPPIDHPERLLYVGITRARRELQISYSRQRGRNAQNTLALPVRAWAGK
jgi:superfamily I DNA/RNA helicase